MLERNRLNLQIEKITRFAGCHSSHASARLEGTFASGLLLKQPTASHEGFKAQAGQAIQRRHANSPEGGQLRWTRTHLGSYVGDFPAKSDVSFINDVQPANRYRHLSAGPNYA